MAIINHRLDLVVRLIDACTGRPVNERGCLFKKDDAPIRLLEKGGGVYFLINEEHINFELSIDVYGYEAKKFMVDFEKLNSRIPEAVVYLLPKKALSLEGVLSGITSLCAVNLASSSCFVNGYDAKKNVIMLFNPHKLRMQHLHYGIIHADEGVFEKVDLSEEDGLEKIKPDAPLQLEFRVNDPIERLVMGEVFPDGRYRIRVSDDATTINYLVRYEVDGKVFFRHVDFHDLHEGEFDTAKDVELVHDQETEVSTQ